MWVEFSTRYEDGIAVVDVKGMLRPRGEGRAFLLPRHVSDLIGQGHNKILLNLEGVTKHDNSGIGELIVCQTVVRKRGAELKLANLSKTMLSHLTLNRLNTVFQIYESEAAAIKAFRQNEGGPVTSLQVSTPHAVHPEGVTKHDNSSLGEQATAIKTFQNDGWSPLQISTRHVDGIAVVDVKGSLRLRRTGRTLFLDRYVSDLIDQGNKKILLNLEGVTGQDSAGVGALIAWAKTVRARRAELKLANVSQSIIAYLTFIRLIKVFQIYENEAAAIEAFRG